MARAKRKRKARAERLHREPIVREVARILATGTPTKFRYESADGTRPSAFLTLSAGRILLQPLGGAGL